MASTPITAPALSAQIQLQQGRGDTQALDSLRALRAKNNLVNATTSKETENSNSEDLSTLKKAANQFESLLIHNMLKSMRKTTMSENTSNERALYDDMFDQRIAETMVEAGGVGLAKHLVSQLAQSPQNVNKTVESNNNHNGLRRLIQNQSEPASIDPALSRSVDSAAVSRLRMISALWGNERNSDRYSNKQQFLQPLKALAQRSAQRLGTSTNAVLAIAALETGWGQHMIRNESGHVTHNYFGIKASSNDKNYTQNLTTEFVNGDPQKMQARFRSYRSAADGMNGFADFILDNPRYSDALQHAGDPERFLKELHKAGYATDPEYAQKVISILHQINSDSLAL